MENATVTGKVRGKKNGTSTAHGAPPVDPAPLLEALNEGAKPGGFGKRTVERILVPPIEAVRMVLSIEGISPLIVHNWSQKSLQEMRDKMGLKAKQPRGAKNPEAEYNGSRYLDEKGRDCVPALALKSCGVEAGVLAGIFKTVLRKAFFVPGILVPIVGTPRMREDTPRVANGSPDLRYRAEYVEWSCEFTIEYNRRVISVEQLVNLYNNAGYSVGLCEWRPEKNGQYGRFRVSDGRDT